MGSFLVKVDLENGRVLAINSSVSNAYNILLTNQLSSSGLLNFHDDVSNGIEILLGIQKGTITTSDYQYYIETSSGSYGYKVGESAEDLAFEELSVSNVSGGPSAHNLSGLYVDSPSPLSCSHAGKETDKNKSVIVWYQTTDPNSDCPDLSKLYAMDNKAVYQKAVIYFSLQSKIKSLIGCTSSNWVLVPTYNTDL